MSVTRPCFTTQHQTWKTKTTVCKTKTDFWSQTGFVLRPTVSDNITDTRMYIFRKRVAHRWSWHIKRFPGKKIATLVASAIQPTGALSCMPPSQKATRGRRNAAHSTLVWRSVPVADRGLMSTVWPPGHKRPPCINGLLNKLCLTLFFILTTTDERKSCMPETEWVHHPKR